MKMNDEIEREIMFNEDATVEIRSADDSNEKQIADIRYFADNGFDIIIVSPNEAAALTPVIEEIYSRGIPVVIFDRDIIGDSYTARIGVDNEEIGKSAAHYAIHLLGRGANAVEIYGLPGSSPAEARHTGFAKEFTAAGGNLVSSIVGNWNKDDATGALDSLLRARSDIDLVYAHNDRMAIGASEVARRLGRDNIKIIGIDAAPDIGIRAVADSVIDATFLYPTEGYRLIRTALSILKGEPFSRESILPASSAVDSSNADILLFQNETIKEETGKMKILKARIDDYWAQHSAQTTLFYASIAIIILMVGIVFLILRAYWQHKRHRTALLEQNEILEQQRNAQQNLNAQLQEAIQSKLVFFTNVSHDLRTPLTLIAEPVAQLASAPNLTPQQQTLVKIADKNVRILHRLINQILDFRKYENNKLELRLTEFDPGKAIDDWSASFRELARRRSMKLEVRPMTSYTPMTLAADAEKLERVFFNLLSNAFKYTPDGGTITVESTLKKGSVFTVTLPVTHVSDILETPPATITAGDVEAELAVIDPDITPDENKPVVLVIDDNADIRKLIAELMKDSFSVISASNGSEGLRKAVRHVPDLIICDVMMPVMDGLECCRRLKSEVTTSHIPVLMLTACSMDEQRVQGYDSGADGYLSKPFSSEVLMARCRSLIENRKRIKELWQKDSLSGSDTPAPSARIEKNADIDNDFYRRFLAIFRKEMGNAELSVDRLASEMGLERTQFYRKIKSLTNFAPVELMRSLRLKQAQLLVKTTDKNMSEIAYETGFSSPAYFTRCYRETFGETPTETRSRIKG